MFIINNSMVIKSNTLRHTSHMVLVLLIKNNYIIESRYYDFNDITCILVSQPGNNTNGFTWFIINHSMVN